MGDEWLRTDKWEAFYAGTWAPHLIGGTDALQSATYASGAAIEALPWRTKETTPQLVEFLERGQLLATGRCCELGCGTGENLVCLANATAFVLGIDVVQAAVAASTSTLKAAEVSNGQVICADILELFACGSAVTPLADGGGWSFDFLLDVQTFHCLRKVDERRAAAVYDSLLTDGGTLLMLTGNADDPAERGPERLTRDQVLACFKNTRLSCEECVEFRFAWTDAYRRQPYDEPPLGWCSIWRKRPSTSSLAPGA